MDRIAEAIKRVKGYTWIKIPFMPAVEHYVDAADPTALKQVTALINGWGFANEFIRALRPPREWQDRDRRVVHILFAAAVDEEVWRWMNQFMGCEGPADDI